MTDTSNETARRKALELLRLGLCTLSEAAHLAGVDRQLVRYWAQRAGIDPMSTRKAKLERIWQRRK